MEGSTTIQDIVWTGSWDLLSLENQQAWLNSIRPDLAKQLGTEWPDQLELELRLYENRDLLRRAIGKQAKKPWVIVFTHAQKSHHHAIIHVLTPKEWDTFTVAELPAFLLHEMVHVLHFYHRGKLGPSWFAEGMAHSVAHGFKPKEIEKALPQIPNGRTLDSYHVWNLDATRNLVDFRPWINYPEAIDFLIGYRIFRKLNDAQRLNIFRMFFQGEDIKEAFVKTLNQPWKTLRLIPGTLITNKLS